jgi:hypothetical protein
MRAVGSPAGASLSLARPEGCARREGLRATHAAPHVPEPLTGIRVVVDHE